MSNVTSGNDTIDARYQVLTQHGIELSLFTVSAKLSFEWQGAVKVSTRSGAATFTGQARLSGALPLDVTISLEIRVDGSYVLELPLRDPWSMVRDVVRQAPSNVRKTVERLVEPYLRTYRDCTLIVTSAGGEHERFGELVAGVSFYAVVKAADVEPLRSLHQVKAFAPLGLDRRTLLLHTASIADPNLTFVTAGSLELGVELGTPAVVIDRLSLRVDANAEELAACAKVAFRLHVGGERLAFLGSLALSSRGSMTIAGSLDATDGEWREPFGLQGLTVTGFGVQLTATTTPPYFGIGARGGIYIGKGKLGGEMAILFDPAKPEQSILHIDSPAGMALPKLLAGLVAPDNLPRPSELLDVSLENLQLYVAPNGGMIANREYPPGYQLAGDLDLWGWKASLDGRFDYASGGFLYGTMDRIRMPSSPVLIEVSGASDERPTVKLDFTPASRGMRLSGRLAVGLSVQEIDAKLDDQGFEVEVGREKGFYGGAAVKYRKGNFATQVSAGFKFQCSVGGYGIPGIPPVRVEVDVGANLRVDVDTKRILNHVSFRCEAFGKQLALGPIETAVAYSRVEDLARICQKEYTDEITRFLAAELSGGTRAAFEWVQAAWSMTASDVALLFRSCGARCQAVAEGMQQLYQQTAAQITPMLYTMRYAVTDIAGSLKSIYRLGDSETSKLLKSAGATAGEIATVCRQVYGYGATQTAQFMKETLKYGDKTVAKALEQASYAKGAIEDAMKDTFDWGEDAWGAVEDAFRGIV